MRNKIYSEKRRKLYRFVNQVLKNSFITKLIHKDTKDQSIEIDALTGAYNQFGINQFVKVLKTINHQTIKPKLVSVSTEFEKILRALETVRNPFDIFENESQHEHHRLCLCGVLLA